MGSPVLRGQEEPVLDQLPMGPEPGPGEPFNGRAGDKARSPPRP